MGWVMAAVSVVKGVTEVNASNDAAQESYNRGEYQLANSMTEGRHVQEQAGEEARKILASALVLRGKQVATQAASGLLVGDGSSADMIDETERLAKEDTFITLMNGERGYLYKMEEGRLAKREADIQAKSYIKQGNASLLSAAGSAASSMSGGSPFTQSAAPIRDSSVQAIR